MNVSNTTIYITTYAWSSPADGSSFNMDGRLDMRRARTYRAPKQLLLVVRTKVHERSMNCNAPCMHVPSFNNSAAHGSTRTNCTLHVRRAGPAQPAATLSVWQYCVGPTVGTRTVHARLGLISLCLLLVLALTSSGVPDPSSAHAGGSESINRID